MEPLAFPEPSLLVAWIFFALVSAITLTAALTDYRREIIPNWLTAPACLLGLLFHGVRGAWLAAQLDQALALGAWQGLLFALQGFGLLFGLFFVMWVLGTCQGGDLKLFAAVGAWLGMERSIIVLVATVLVAALLFGFRWLGRNLGSAKPVTAKPGAPESRRPSPTPEYVTPQKRRKRLIYAPALALCTALYLLWNISADLHVPLKAAKPERSAASRR